MNEMLSHELAISNAKPTLYLSDDINFESSKIKMRRYVARVCDTTLAQAVRCESDETPPRVSIIDVVMAVTGGSQHDAARSLRRLSDQYPEVGPNWSHLLQAAPRCKQAGKRRTLRPPVLKKSNPVSQGEDDALKMSNPPRWRHRVRFFRRAIRVRARGFEISVRLGEQPTNQENTELKKSISKKDFQVKKNVFWSPATQSTFDSSGAPKGSNF